MTEDFAADFAVPEAVTNNGLDLDESVEDYIRQADLVFGSRHEASGVDGPCGQEDLAKQSIQSKGGFPPVPRSLA